MQVRAGGPAGLADRTDRIVLRHARALAYRHAAKVRIHGGVLPVVTEDHDVAIAALRAGVLDDTVAHGAHARAGRGRVIDALMLLPRLRDRVAAHAEARAHARDLPRTQPFER